MVEMVDNILFEELAARESDTVTLAPLCVFDPQKMLYRVSVWETTYEIDPHKKMICSLEKNEIQHDYFYVFLVNYLLSEKRAQPTGEWISEKDLVGGATFFRGPHEIPTKMVTDSYGNDLQRLKTRCLELGGKELTLADCSYSFDIIASVHAALLYWQGDEDFPPEAKILIDSSVAKTLKLDVVYALLCDICSRLAGKQ